MGTDRIQLKSLLITVVAVTLLEIFAAPVARLADSAAARLLFLGVLRLLDIAVMISIVTGFEGSAAAIGLDASTFLQGIKRGGLWSLCFAVVVATMGVVFIAFGLHPLQLLKTQFPGNNRDGLLLLLVGGFIAPFAEEILFRGIVFRYFRPWGFWLALTASTFSFAALHSANAGFYVPQIVGGILFASAFEVENNLAAPIVIHILGNLAIFSITFITL